jgi:hypothetical protein
MLRLSNLFFDVLMMIGLVIYLTILGMVMIGCACWWVLRRLFRFEILLCAICLTGGEVAGHGAAGDPRTTNLVCSKPNEEQVHETLSGALFIFSTSFEDEKMDMADLAMRRRPSAGQSHRQPRNRIKAGQIFRERTDGIAAGHLQPGQSYSRQSNRVKLCSNFARLIMGEALDAGRVGETPGTYL